MKNSAARAAVSFSTSMFFGISVSAAGKLVEPMSKTSAANSKVLIAKSADQRVPLLELYSSEGCSSCPPADEWTARLKSQAGLWKTFVPVAFHVDYWNSLGWRDQWSSEEWTTRQRSYAAQWKNDAVYTPAFVLNGKEWRDWRKVSPPQVSVLREPSPIGLAIYQIGKGVFSVHADGLKAGHSYTIRVALLGMDLSSSVTAGENSGQILKHNFVVERASARSVHASSVDEKFEMAGASSKNAIAAWVEEDGNLTPLQAAGGPL